MREETLLTLLAGVGGGSVLGLAGDASSVSSLALLLKMPSSPVAFFLSCSSLARSSDTAAPADLVLLGGLLGLCGGTLDRELLAYIPFSGESAGGD